MSTRRWTGILPFVLAITSIAANVGMVRQVREESSMKYRLVHPLHTVEAISKEVLYDVRVDTSTHKMTSVSARADVATFDSGNSNRDSHAMEAIDALTYPEVLFTSSSVSQHGDSLSITGRLTFHGVTRELVIPARSEWSQHRFRVTGDFKLSLTAFGVERPSLFMIPVEDSLSFSFTASFELH